MTVQIENESVAKFRCRHKSADSLGWRVNGSQVQQFPDINTTSIRENAALLSTLTIPARSQYNKTMVECLAFLDGSPTERTPPATLILTAGLVAVHPIASSLPRPIPAFQYYTHITLNRPVDNLYNQYQIKVNYV